MPIKSCKNFWEEIVQLNEPHVVKFCTMALAKSEQDIIRNLLFIDGITTMAKYAYWNEPLTWHIANEIAVVAVYFKNVFEDQVMSQIEKKRQIDKTSLIYLKRIHSVMDKYKSHRITVRVRG